MNFNEANMCPVEETPIPQATLSELMGNAKGMGEDAFVMAKTISSHLFGEELNGIEKSEVNCHRDVLQRHCKTLEMLCCELDKIVCLLGYRK